MMEMYIGNGGGTVTCYKHCNKMIARVTNVLGMH